MHAPTLSPGLPVTAACGQHVSPSSPIGQAYFTAWAVPPLKEGAVLVSRVVLKEGVGWAVLVSCAAYIVHDICGVSCLICEVYRT
jgi:hypothetical protein